MDDFVMNYLDVIENDELDASLISQLQQESYLYSMREKINELLNNKNIKL